jgi:2-dehydropantoate 2-reductase
MRMRILVVGAGAIGGYFGARLLAAGRDVTFLVRPARQAALARTGLVVRSPRGDVELANPPTVTAASPGGPYDLVLLSCKAYDLDAAIADLAPALGPATAILPLLNGIAHMDVLDRRFGAGRVLGGTALISTTLDAEGRILHLAEAHNLTFGARPGAESVADQVAPALTGAGFDAVHSPAILQDMWEKFVFIASGAGLTCLMRATVGDIVAAGGADLARQIIGECGAIAAGAGHPPREAALARATAMFTTPGSPITASMLRDIEGRGRIEADHVIGDLLSRAPDRAKAPLLFTAYIHLKAYEARRARGALPG